VTEGKWWFVPLLPGATVRDRALACAGALAGVALIGISANLAGHELHDQTWILAPVGASAVLVFAVPATPLAQPWPVIGGSTISALTGVVCVHLISPEPLAAGVAVAAAIAVMTVARCLHPPGGAAALTAVLAATTDTDIGTLFPVVPILLDSLAIVALAWVFHRVVTGHSYPHRALVPSPGPGVKAGEGQFTDADLDAVLGRVGSTYDINREDLEAILDAVQTEAAQRRERQKQTGAAPPRGQT